MYLHKPAFVPFDHKRRKGIQPQRLNEPLSDRGKQKLYALFAALQQISTCYSIETELIMRKKLDNLRGSVNKVTSYENHEYIYYLHMSSDA